MKKQIIILALLLCAFSFAQKKELKVIEKAIKSKNFAEAKETLKQAEGLVSNMDSKLKEKYYYLASQAFYANGAATNEDLDVALRNLASIEGTTYTNEIAGLKTAITNSLLTKGNKAYEQKDLSTASKYFEKVYRVSPQDTLFLYNAAVLASQVKQYDRALKIYDELKEVNYSGEEKEYFATDKKNNKEVVLDKATRDSYVAKGIYTQPGERLVGDSKKLEIFKNISLLHIAKGNNKKALEAMAEARAAYPENVGLILSEADVYYKMGNEEKFKTLMEEAAVKEPNNHNVHYNIGVMNMQSNKDEEALDSFNHVLKLKPDFADAALNISTIYIDKGNVLIEKMNALGTSSADNKKYDQLKAKKTDFFKKGTEVLNNFLEKNSSSDINILEQLKNIYMALGEVQKSKEIKAKIEATQG